MSYPDIEELLVSELGLAEAHVTGDGSHFQIIAVSDIFNEMSRVKRQQAVYKVINDRIADGSMHAISIKTFSEKDWQRERMFNQPL